MPNFCDKVPGSGSVVTVSVRLAGGGCVEWSGEAPGFYPVELVPNQAAMALCEDGFQLLHAVCGCVSALDCGGAAFIREGIGPRIVALGDLRDVVSVAVSVDNSRAGEGWESGTSVYCFGDGAGC